MEVEFASLCSKRHSISHPVDSVAVPIYTSSTYLMSSANHGAKLCERLPLEERESKYLYSRWGNPTTDVAREVINSLEKGAISFVLSSGMAAISTTLLSFLKSGDHVVAPNSAYSGTFEFMKTLLSRYGIETTFVDSRDASNYEKAFKSNTKVFYGESPANPTISLLDLQTFSSIARRLNVITVIDSTLASPYNINPIDFGIDVIIHSATKYLGGHSDLLAGTITLKHEKHGDEIFETMKLLGNNLSAFDSFLLQRGIKTLDVRMERHNKNALEIAKFLENHPKVERVYYPGLESHPQHELAKKQLKGYGGMISFEVKGGIEGGKKIIESVRLISLAVSLGGVDSLIEHAASMTHTMVDPEIRRKAGITDGLIRFSVGLEDSKDLIKDLDQALSQV